jgi:hypothetical protein
MELLLNLIWLLLFVPACLIWRTTRRSPDTYSSNFVLLLLACTLAILFPVVSASDDIQAMRPEMEEVARDAISSPHHSRFLCLAPDSNTSVPQHVAHPARLLELRSRAIVPFVLCLSPAAPFLEVPSGRAPPALAFS